MKSFLQANKRESVDAMIFDREAQAFPKFPKLGVCNVFTIFQKSDKDEVEFFCMQINTKVSCKLISKVFHKVILSLLMSMIKHSQNTQSSTSAISLQYLKREVKDV